MEYKELTHKIIGCAYRVFNQLGFGFLEIVYRRAMVIELEKADLKVEEEKSLQVFYDEVVVGNFSIDLYVEDTIVVELKSVQNILIEHEIQLVNYLKGMKRDIGLLINFSQSGVDVKRKFKEYDKGE